MRVTQQSDGSLNGIFVCCCFHVRQTEIGFLRISWMAFGSIEADEISTNRSDRREHHLVWWQFGNCVATQHTFRFDSAISTRDVHFLSVSFTSCRLPIVHSHAPSRTTRPGAEMTPETFCSLWLRAIIGRARSSIGERRQRNGSVKNKSLIGRTNGDDGFLSAEINDETCLPFPSSTERIHYGKVNAECTQRLALSHYSWITEENIKCRWLGECNANS